MKHLFAVLLTVSALAFSAPATAVVVVTNELTTSSHFASDTLGSFYYDLYRVTNTTAGNLLVDLGLEPEGAMPPWMAFVRAAVLPAAFWGDVVYNELGTNSSAADFGPIAIDDIFLGPLASILVAVSTRTYLPEALAQLDDYTLTLAAELSGGTGPTDGLLLVEQILPAAVPAPYTPALLLVGFAGLALMRRRIARLEHESRRRHSWGS